MRGGGLHFLLALSALLSFHSALSFSEHRPWAEYEKVGWLVMSSSAGFDSLKAKHRILENIPKDVKVLIYTQYYVDIDQLQTYYGKFIASGQVHFTHFPLIGEGFWAQDALPTAVVLKNSARTFGLVGARHALYFEPDSLLATFFQVPLREHNIEFEGGNLLATHRGECLIVDGFRERQMADAHFQDHYGCTQVIRFPHQKDIGHIDERVKVISQDLALTDSAAYRRILELHGYRVLMVPDFQEPYRSYLNSIIINGTAFVPVFGDPQKDQAALRAYQYTGAFHKIVPVDSQALVDQGSGGIHCFSATFPPTPWLAL